MKYKQSSIFSNNEKIDWAPGFWGKKEWNDSETDSD